jgi:hypothetical protein
MLLDCVRIRTYVTLRITKHDWLLQAHKLREWQTHLHLVLCNSSNGKSIISAAPGGVENAVEATRPPASASAGEMGGTVGKVSTKRKRCAEVEGNGNGDSTATLKCTTAADEAIPTNAAATAASVSGTSAGASTSTDANPGPSPLVLVTLMSFGHSRGRPFDQQRVFDIRAVPHCK